MAHQSSRIDYLDGIRGWAAVVVMMGHIVTGVTLRHFYPDAMSDGTVQRLYAEFLTSGMADAISIFLHIAAIKIAFFLLDGHFAVLIFFVLSGYALSHHQLDMRRRNLPLAAAARYFRLTIPIAATTLIALACLSSGLFFNLDAAARYPEQAIWLGTFYKFPASIRDAVGFSLWDVFFHYNTRTTYNSSLWTMPTELAGSLLIFSFLALFRQGTRAQWKVISIVTICSWFYSAFLGCFMFGYILAEANERRVLDAWKDGWQREALLIGSFVCASLTEPFASGNDHFSSILAYLLVVSVSGSRILKGFFSNSVARFLGRVSFPLYLIQIIVICSWSSYFLLMYPALNLGPFASATILVVTSATLCLVSSKLLLPVERLSITASKTFGRRIISIRERSAAEQLSSSAQPQSRPS